MAVLSAFDEKEHWDLGIKEFYALANEGKVDCC